jgi:hypothetical protein
MEVYVQKPNRPDTREHIGSLKFGCKPTDGDYRAWGLDPAHVIASRTARIKGEQCYLVVVAP